MTSLGLTPVVLPAVAVTMFTAVPLIIDAKLLPNVLAPFYGLAPEAWMRALIAGAILSGTGSILVVASFTQNAAVATTSMIIFSLLSHIVIGVIYHQKTVSAELLVVSAIITLCALLVSRLMG